MEEARPRKDAVCFQATRGQRAASFQGREAANERFQLPVTPMPQQPGGGQQLDMRHAENQLQDSRMLSAKFKGQTRRSHHSWTGKQQRQQIKYLLSCDPSHKGSQCRF